MKKVFLALAFAMPLAAYAQVTPYAVEGDFTGRGDGGDMSLRTITADSDKGLVVAHAEVGAQGCAGDFVGIGQLKGNSLRLSPFVKDSDTASCVVTVSFDKTGKKAKVSEDGCMSFHGAACDFDGQVTKKR
ncbi:hypothetical protein [Paraburkholderia sp. DGU8]|uniref:hypothetical protein n=1 Tax=Paraburkholderia sp. DGU8 TaxID=3161997 RepID=UPI003467C7EF